MTQWLVDRLLPVFIGLSGGFSVLFGAWLSHQGSLLSLEALSNVSTALEYQFIHTVALLAVLVWYRHSPTKPLLLAMFFYCIGIVGFCFSMYLKSILGYSFVGKLTPFGGISLALAWFHLAYAGIRK